MLSDARDVVMKKLKAMKQYQVKSQADFEEQIQQLTEGKQQLSTLIETLEKEKQQAMDLATEKDNQMKTLTEEMDKLKSSLEERSEQSQQENNKEEMVQQVEKLEALCKELREENQSLEQRLREQSVEVETVKAEVMKKDELLVHSSAEVKGLKSDLSFVTEELKKSQELCTSEQRFKEDLQNEIDNLEFQIHELMNDKEDESQKEAAIQKEATEKPKSKVQETAAKKNGKPSPRGSGAIPKTTDIKKRLQQIAREKEQLEQEMKKVLAKDESLSYEISEKMFFFCFNNCF